MNTISDEVVGAALDVFDNCGLSDWEAMRAALSAAQSVTEREQAEQQKSATAALFDPSRLPARDEDGRVTHPDYSIVVTTDDEVDVTPFFTAHGLELRAVGEEFPENCAHDSSLFWFTPEPPAGEGWRLVSIYDNEDGEAVALYCRRVTPQPSGSAVDALLLRAYEVVHHDAGCPAIGGNGDGDCRCDAVAFLRDLEAALRTPSPAQVPKGWKLVPIEPTAEMKEAGGAYRDRCKEQRVQKTVGGYYRAMLAAAPTPPSAEQ